MTTYAGGGTTVTIYEPTMITREAVLEQALEEVCAERDFLREIVRSLTQPTAEEVGKPSKEKESSDWQ